MRFCDSSFSFVSLLEGTKLLGSGFSVHRRKVLNFSGLVIGQSPRRAWNNFLKPVSTQAHDELANSPKMNESVRFFIARDQNEWELEGESSVWGAVCDVVRLLLIVVAMQAKIYAPRIRPEIESEFRRRFPYLH